MGSSWSFDASALVEKLSSSDESVREAAAKSVSDAASKAESKRRALTEAGAIPKLLDMARAGSLRGKECAAAALGHLAMLQENKELIAQEGAIPVMLQLLKEDELGIRGAALTALSSLASKSQQNQAAIAKEDGVKPMVRCLHSSHNQVREWAAAAVGNVTLQHPGNQTLAAEAGAISSLVAMMKAEAPLPQLPAAPDPKDLASFLARVCRRRAPAAAGEGVGAPVDAVASGAAVASSDGDSAGDEQSTLATADDDAPPSKLTCSAKGKVWVTRALSSLAFNHAENRNRIIDAGGVEPLAELVRSGSDEDRIEGAKALLNIVGANTDGKLKCGQAGCIPALVKLCEEGKKLSDKEMAAGLLGNLAGGCSENQTKIAKAGGVTGLAGLLQIGTAQGKLWAAVAIANLAEGTEEVKTRIGKDGAIRPLVWLAEEGSPQARAWASKAIATLGKDHEENQRLIKLHGGVMPKQDLAATGMRLRSMEEMHPAKAEGVKELREVAQALAAEKDKEQDKDAEGEEGADAAPAAVSDSIVAEEDEGGTARRRQPRKQEDNEE